MTCAQPDFKASMDFQYPLGISGDRYDHEPSHIRELAQDREWWRVMQSADDTAANRACSCLYVRYWGPLVQLTASLTSRQNAEDIVQSVFTGIWVGRHTLRLQGSVRAYLFRAVRNRTSNARRDERRALRHRARWGSIEYAPAHMGRTIGPEEQLDLHASDSVSLDVSMITDRQWLVVILRMLDYTYVEIAMMLGISVKTVGTHLYRARRSLEKQRHVVPRLSPPSGGRSESR
jgi:RNA polymerase sigma-70 factor (ECF subfamily)